MPDSRLAQHVSLLPEDPYRSARLIGLRYVRDSQPGISRIRVGKKFIYLYPDGKRVQDPQELERIRLLVIPPAWTDVWICPFANGHLQAVGRDAWGRKQYRYHALYRQVRDYTKYERIVPFANLLPSIRTQVRSDLKLRGFPKEKILAVIVRLLETTCIRVGNEEYVKENESFGLTTLKNEHVRVRGSSVLFHFKGKSGQMHDIELNDGMIAKILQECKSIPGEELFRYVAENGRACKVSSDDVNRYLRRITGEHFTAKSFRTWVGTKEAARQFYWCGPPRTDSEVKRRYSTVVKAVATRLGNRPATSRKYYIHPAIVDSYLDGSLFNDLQPQPEGASDADLRIEELSVVGLILLHQEVGSLPGTFQAA